MSVKKHYCVFACDMGGTFIKSACVLSDGTIIGKMKMTPSNSEGSLEEIIESWKEVFSCLLEESSQNRLESIGIGVCTPGPFNYKEKISLMRHKFKSIYGVNLGQEIQKAISLPTIPFKFFQDSNCFLAGEQHYGAVKGVMDCACVTLGTGLGFSVMTDGKILTNGRNACYIALFRQPWMDGIIEDVVSGPGLVKTYRELSAAGEEVDTKEIGRRAKNGDKVAAETYRHFGTVLGRGIAFHLVHTRVEMLVVGGQISKDFPLFEKSLIESLNKGGWTGTVRPAVFPEDAALYGVAAEIL
jgi:glucokinase